MRRLAAACACVVAAGLLVAWSGCGGRNTPAERINEDAGTFRGVAIGDPADSLQQLDGECRVGELDWTPCDEDAGSLTEPHTLSGGWDSRKFSGVTYFTGLTGVKGFVVSEGSAVTNREISPGDSLDDAREAYPGMDCDVVQFEDSTGGPYCTLQLPRARVLIFGGDPIDSIVVARRGAG